MFNKNEKKLSKIVIFGINSNMKYSIKDLERITGIQAHTIRTWEKRYNILNPKRSDTNIRYYEGEDLKKLLNITTLMEGGMKISMVAALKPNEILDRIRSVTDGASDKDFNHIAIINQMVEAAANLNEAGFEKAFSSALIRFSFNHVYEFILYPFLRKIGMMWTSNDMNPIQEHFIINLIKQKLFTAIDALPNPDVNQDTWLLFLPENENHEIGLLMAYYLLKSKNNQVIYLGQNVPFSYLKNTIEDIKAENLLFFKAKSITRDEQIDYVKKLLSASTEEKIWVCGELLDYKELSEETRLKIVSTFRDFA